MGSTFTDVSESPLNMINLSVKIFSPERSLDLAAIVGAVTEVFELNPYTYSIDFEQEGCEWKLFLSKDENLSQSSSSSNECRNVKNKYWIHGMVLEGGNTIDIMYTVSLCLMSPTKTLSMFLDMFTNGNK